MGVDYSANFGFGIKVLVKEFEEDSEFCDDFQSYLNEITRNTPYHWFAVGDEMYSGNDNDFYVVVNAVFSSGYDKIEQKGKELLAFLSEHEIRTEGKLDIVGGLEIS